MRPNRIHFCILGKKGLFVLENFLKEFGSSQIDQVWVGRDLNIAADFSDAIISLCENHSLKNKVYRAGSEMVVASDSTVFSIGWKWMIHQDAPVVVFHDSLLPKYRGFSPVVSALVNGDSKIGVTALLGGKKYDCGDILSQEEILFCYPITIQEAGDLLLPAYWSLVKKIAMEIFNGEELKGVPQDESEATYSLWRDDDDYWIDWSKDASAIARFIDAVGMPYRGAKTTLNEDEVVITKSSVLNDVKIVNRIPGKTIFIEDGCPVVVCGRGLLKVEQVHRRCNQDSLLPIKNIRTRFR